MMSEAAAFALAVVLMSLTCSSSKMHWPHGLSDIEIFERYANNATVGPGTYQDKTSGHKYQELYGEQLMPYIRKQHKSGKAIKFLEIGLGCNKGLHYGAGIDIWKHLFSDKDELWVSEIDALCVESARKRGILEPRVNALVGNQEDYKHLDAWQATHKGGFNVIIDDGGHHTGHIITTFYYMFEKSLAPGGLYFIEDMQVNGFSPFIWKDPKKNMEPYRKPVILMEVLAAWTQEIITGHYIKPVDRNSRLDGYSTADQIDEWWSRTRLPLPKGVKSMFCYPEACMFRKCEVGDKNQRCIHGL
jgi:hypothetical protein